MAYSAGSLGTTTTTVLTPAIVWGDVHNGLTYARANITAAQYAAGNYTAALADMNAKFQYQDGYDVTNEEFIGSSGSEVTRQWAAIVNGILYYPGGRGMLKLYPGDVIAVDPNTGWPVLINSASATGGTTSWHVSPNE